MASERIQRQIDHLLDEAEEAFDQGDWNRLSDRANRVLLLDAENNDAFTFLTAAKRALGAPSESALPPAVGELHSPTGLLGYLDGLRAEAAHCLGLPLDTDAGCLV